VFEARKSREERMDRKRRTQHRAEMDALRYQREATVRLLAIFLAIVLLVILLGMPLYVRLLFPCPPCP
jgi:Flp pilus assembly protein TadB